MDTIVTTLPIPADVIREIVTTKPSKVYIDLDHTKLPPQGILTYLTNLGTEVTFMWIEHQRFLDLLKAYMESPMFHKFVQLEIAALEVLSQIKGIVPESGNDYDEFIRNEDNREILTKWLRLTESLQVYMCKWLDDEESQAFLKAASQDTTTDIRGINMARLIQHEQMAIYLAQPPMFPPTYYTHFFDKRIYGGSTLENYWCNPSNVVYMTCMGFNQGLVDFDEAEAICNQSLDQIEKELANV